MSMTPNKPEHANYSIPVRGGMAGTDGSVTVERHLRGYSYPVNGNVHNPTPRYDWLLRVDGRLVDQFTTRRDAVAAGRTLNYRDN